MFGCVRFYYEGDGSLCNEMFLVGSDKDALHRLVEKKVRSGGWDMVIKNIRPDDIPEYGRIGSLNICLILPLRDCGDGIWELVL